VYKEFSNAKKGVLFCTDVVARGLDFENVQWIVQYDPPCEITDYLHRAGRTARKGLSGQSVIFLLPSEAAYVQILYSHSLTPEPLSLQTLFADVVQHIPGAAKFKNNDEMAAVILQRRLERVALASK
jgi:ATP-dependent RNA helicase DDX31/DBP7